MAWNLALVKETRVNGGFEVVSRKGGTSSTGGVGRNRKHVGDTTGQVVMQGPGRFSCRLCGSVYKHLASLTQHLEVHRNQTTCILCHTTLSRRTDLRRHMRLKHNMQWQKTIQKQRSSKNELDS